MRRILENIIIAFKSLGLNRLRSFLTMLGIIIGVGAVVAVMSISAGAEASIVENIQNAGTNIITISPGREGPSGNRREHMGGFSEEEETNEGDLYLEDAEALKKESKFINEAVPSISGKSTISYLSWNGDISVTGTSENFLSVMGYELDKGGFFTASDVSNMSNVVVLGDTVVDDYFGKINPIGEVIKIDGKNFTVIGTVETVGASSDNTIYMPITTVQNKLFGIETLNSITAQVESEDLISQAIEDSKDILRRQHSILPGEGNDFEIRSNTQMLEVIGSVTDTLTIALGGIAAISLLVGGIGIMNIMLVSVTERTREIGIRKAVGAKNKDILIQFLTESIVLSLLGGIIGVGFAGMLSWILTSLTPLSAILTAFPIILALSFSTGIGLVFGIFPAMRAARLSPIDALRYE